MRRAVVYKHQNLTARNTTDIAFKPPKPTEVKLLLHPIFLVRVTVGPNLGARLAFNWMRPPLPSNDHQRHSLATFIATARIEVYAGLIFLGRRHGTV